MSLKSIIFVPANRSDLLGKACSGNATAICLDLEDAITPENKAAARKELKNGVSAIKDARKAALVRVNSEPEFLSDDLASLTETTDYVVLPKAGSTSQINSLASDLEKQFKQSSPKIVCLIESGADIDRLRQSSEPLHSSVQALALGTEDLAVDFSTTPNTPVIEHCFYELAILCHRWSILLLGYPGTIAEFRDLELFGTKVTLGAQAGASGGFAIHPKQIDVLNSTFTPSQKEIEKAECIVEAFDTAILNGSGVCSLDGKMIDKPVYLNAKNLLARAS